MVGFAWISIAAIVAFLFAARHHLTWDDLLNYGMILPLTVLLEAVHSPYFWIVAVIIWLNVMIGRAWRTHCNQQQRIIKLLEEFDRNELARYNRLSEKVESIGKTRPPAP